jgi:hypothetical protein
LAIPLDTYFIVSPGSEFVSKGYANLNGTDLFFYITETKALRVVNMNSTISSASPGNISYTLAQNVRWLGVIQATGVVHLYYADDNTGQISYIAYTQFGQPFRVVSTTIGHAVTFSVTFAPNSNPPAYLMMVDDAVHLNFFAASDPQFQSVLGSEQAYNNAIDHNFYTTRPSIAVHPQDTDRVTVHVQQINLHNSTSQVGFFVLRIPGVA